MSLKEIMTNRVMKKGTWLRIPKGVSWDMVRKALKEDYRSRLRLESHGQMARRRHGSKRRGSRKTIPRRVMAATLALLAGRRRGEIAMLRREHVHRNMGYITRHVLKKGRPVTIELPMGRELMGKLKTWWVMHGRPATGRVVPGNPEAWSQGVHRRGKKHGWNLRFHDLRHLFALHLIDIGAPLVVVRKALAHSSLTTTTLYLEVMPKDLRPYMPRVFT